MKITDYANCADEELVELSHAGDDLATDVLIRRYTGLVRQKALHYFLVGADQDDLLQEALIGLFKATRDFKPDYNVPFRSFAETCIKRQIATAIKAARRLKHTPLNNSVSLNKPLFEGDDEIALVDVVGRDSLPNPEEIVINKERFHILSERIQSRLSRFERQVLNLYLQGHSYQEIALILEKPQKAIDNALQRIKHKIEVIAGE